MPNLIDDQPLINGRAYSYSDIRVDIAGAQPRSVSKVSWKAKQEKKNNMGIGREPISRGYGGFEYDASIEMSLEDVLAIKATAPKGSLLAIPPFPIIVAWLPEGGRIVTVELSFCEFTEDAIDTSSGDTDTKVKLPLIIAGVKYK